MPPNIFKIEEHGIDSIPGHERTKSWWDLFAIQAAVNITLPSLLIGGLLVPGLSWAQACWAMILGYAFLGVLLALMGYIGVDRGIPNSVASRLILGYPRGMWFSSLSILVSLVGWFAVTIELAGFAVDGFLKNTTGFSSPSVMIALIAVLNSIPAVIGFENIKWVSRLAVPAMFGLTVWILVTILSNFGGSGLLHYRATSDVTFSRGLDLVVGGLIVAVFIAPDYSRYLRSRQDNWIGALSGVLPFSVFMGIVGGLSKLTTGDWNAFVAVQKLGLGWPAVLIIMLSTWGNNNSSLYSSGLALTNLFPQLKRWQSTLVVSALGMTLGTLRISKYFANFLLLLSDVFSPLVGIFLCDYFLVRKGNLDLAEAYSEKGVFFNTRGINLAALSATGIGFLIAKFTPSSYMASLAALILTAIIYFFLIMVFYPERKNKSGAASPKD